MKYAWPEGATFNCNQHTLDWPSKEKCPVEYMFAVSFPAPDKAGIRPLYISGRGECKSTWFAHGYGPNALEAEDAAWKKYQEIINCQHDAQAIAHVDLPDDQPKVYLLDGDAICSKCQIYLPFYYMDVRLHRSMCLAHRGHDGQKRKYNGRHYIEHPKQVYTRTAFWEPKRPQEDRVVMGCAAWMHDLKEDCPHISDEEMIEAGGERAFELVKWLTNPSKGVKASRAKRKQMDREHLATAPKEAKIIKMFDRICNLNDMGGCDDPDFLKLYAAESRLLWEVVYDADDKIARELLAVIEAVERRVEC